MHELEYHRRVEKALRKFPVQRSGQILAALEKLAEAPDPSKALHVKKMQGDSEGRWRLRIGEYRAIFKLVPDGEDETQFLISVTHVGTRGDVYD
ncbi:MAG TPA: type II toxin-antitoxin system RelE/ParE family toxin [Verrucomicrobiales bacterium]|jgi:mRNA interferase RelE/StbE|nr:type II toxin-antitoxin system RelE/ParE family toxin [Verrucomicrobiales bacterium]